MSVFDYFREKNRGVTTPPPPPAEERFVPKSSIDEAEYTAELIQNSIDHGDYTGFEREIQSVVGPSRRVEYVFPAYFYKPGGFSLFAKWIIFAAGIYLLLVSVALLVYGGTLAWMGAPGLIVCVLIILSNIITARRSKAAESFSKRYDAYSSILKFRQIEFVEDLANMTQTPKDLVIRDLKRAVKECFIPEGHFAFDDSLFMVSDAIYEDYLRRPDVYKKYYVDRFQERKEDRYSQAAAEVIRLGNQYVDSIRYYNMQIKEEEMSRKLERLEQTTAAIFHEVHVNPKQAKKLNLLMSYYLPTTEKILHAYIDIDSKQIGGQVARQTKKDILHAVDVINVAYENILQKFYEEQAFEISVEVSALEEVMKRKGLG